MMFWVPRLTFAFAGGGNIFDDADFDGIAIGFTWLGFVAELTLGRVIR